MVSLRLPPLPTVQDIVRLYRLSAIKQLSQNFLMNEQLTDKIVKCTGKINNAQVLEVGPGPGAITRSIIRKCPKRLIVIEKDERFKPSLGMLKDAFSTINGQMEVVFNDILNVDLNNIFEEEEKREWNDQCPNVYLLGNLPFKISTPLILKWLQDIAEKRNAWSNGRVQMTLTFQKEVAERLVADVGENQRCRLSIMAQTWTVPKLRFIIPGSAFVPKPEVDVGVVSFTPLKKPRTNHEFQLFEKVNRHLFSFRQKYCIKCASCKSIRDKAFEIMSDTCCDCCEQSTIRVEREVGHMLRFTRLADSRPGKNYRVTQENLSTIKASPVKISWRIAN